MLAIGDLGIGIPEHLRRTRPSLSDDGEAISVATEEGVTGTDDQHRGRGFYWISEAMRQSALPGGVMQIWSGEGRFTLVVRDGEEAHRHHETTPEGRTAGTWIRLHLSA